MRLLNVSPRVTTQTTAKSVNAAGRGLQSAQDAHPTCQRSCSTKRPSKSDSAACRYPACIPQPRQCSQRLEMMRRALVRPQIPRIPPTCTIHPQIGRTGDMLDLSHTVYFRSFPPHSSHEERRAVIRVASHGADGGGGDFGGTIVHITMSSGSEKVMKKSLTSSSIISTIGLGEGEKVPC